MEDKVALHRLHSKWMTPWRSGMTTMHAKTNFYLFDISLVLLYMRCKPRLINMTNTRKHNIRAP